MNSKPEKNTAPIVKQAVRMHCDRIKLRAKNVELEGWAISTQGIDRIEVYCDDQFLSCASYGLLRPDVQRAYPLVPDSNRSGCSLAFEFDQALAPGKHDFLIKAIARDGESSSIRQVAEPTLDEPRGSNSAEGFDRDLYLDLYPDVAAAGVDPHLHYVQHGRAEGRIGAISELEVLGSFSSFAPSRETILIVSHEGSRTGAPILSYNLVKEFCRKYNVAALFLGPGPMREACRAAGAVVLGPFTPKPSRSVYEYVIRRITERGPIKFALVNSVESRAVLPALAKHFIPAISLVHEFAAYTRPRGALREALFWSGQSLFSSTVTRDNAWAEYPDSQDRHYPIIPQGHCIFPEGDGSVRRRSVEEAAVLRNAMRPAGFPGDGVVILGAGSVHIRKGVDLFIECASRVVRAAPHLPCRFVWVGKGYDPECDGAYSIYLADQISRAGLEKHFQFVDEVADLEAAYALADILFMSSRLDPLPNVAINALVKGIPVVCFDKTTGMADILRDNGLAQWGVAAYLDTEEAARKIVALAASSELRKQVGARSAKMAAQTFDMKNYVAQLEELAMKEVRHAEQEKEDVETILKSELLRLDYFCPQKEQQQSPASAVRRYVRSWAGNLDRRKLFPGFHPGIYREQHGVAKTESDPLADYLRAGRPQGPWNFEVISPGEEPKPIPPGIRIGLHIHAYYPDLIPEMLGRLMKNRARPDLLVSVTGKSARQAAAAHLGAYPGKVDIRIVPNRGRDVGPFLTEFGQTILRDYDLIGHLHTKRTTHEHARDASLGQAWYHFLLDNLLGGEFPMADIVIGRMSAEPRIGIVFPDDPHQVGWDKNLRFAERFFADLKISAPPKEIIFPLGTMFWARPQRLKFLFDLNLGWQDYPEEPVPYDGSLLHALERMFGMIASRAGGAVVLTNVPGRSHPCGTQYLDWRCWLCRA